MSFRSLRLAVAIALASLPLAGCGNLDLAGILPGGTGGALVITTTDANPNTTTVTPGQSVQLTAHTNHDPNVYFTWSASEGSLSATTGNPVTWTAPSSGASGTRYQITVTAQDGSGSNTAEFLFTMQ